MTAELTRAARCAAAVLAVVALGAGAAACGPSGKPSSGAAAPSATATVSSSVRPGGDQGTAQPPSEADSSSGGQGGTPSSSRTDGGKGTRPDSGTGAAHRVSLSAAKSRCHTGELGFAWTAGGPDMNATNQQVASVQLTNRGGRTCTLYGFPGIRLISRSGQTWDLPRSADKPAVITLHPGENTAEITVNVLPVPANTTDTRPFAPAKLLITPPDETTQVTLDWPYGGALWHQAGTTSHPETAVNPVGF
jgi:hypothetical protein